MHISEYMGSSNIGDILMPLIKSASRKAIGENIKEMEASGHPRAQAIAAALDTARRAKRKKGGRVHLGPVVGDTGGRADKVDTSVPDGTYVIPSQAVSHLGENNTMAGLKLLQHMFPNSSPKEARKASGGVPVAIADGEFCIAPTDVKRVGGGDMEHGHLVLDHWVNQLKEDHIRTLAGLEPPAKD